MDVDEAGHTPKCNLCNLKYITHYYIDGMEPTNLWWKPNAPEPSGETIAQLEKNQAYKTKAGTGIKIG